MQIGKIVIGKTDKTQNNSNKTNAYLLNEPIKDSFVKTKAVESVNKRLSTADACKEFDNLNNTEWNNKYSEKDKKAFASLYSKKAIDFDTIKKVGVKSDFNMDSMSEIYLMGKDINDSEFTDKLSKSLDTLDKNYKVTRFERSKYEPDTEYSIKIEPKNPTVGNAKMLSFSTEKFEVIGETEKSSNIDTERRQYVEVITSKDFRNNTESVKSSYHDKETLGTAVYKEVITHKDKNGNVTRKDILSESPIEGIFNLKYEYPNGEFKDVVKASVDEKTGIKTIKKDMESSNGTRTEFLYEDDPNGNRIIDYKITKSDGKVLLKQSQTFEVIDENHFVSSKNGMKYEIEKSDKELKIKNLHHNTETSIKFDKMIKGKHQQEVVGMLKKLSGDELFDVVDSLNKIKSNPHEKNLYSYYEPDKKSISTADNLFVFLHELGHAKDSAVKRKDTPDNDNEFYVGNKNIREVYLKERKAFNKNFPPAQRDHIDYFIQARGHYQGQWGGLSEIVAETNALANTYTDSSVKELSSRTHYLQQHFPETIAAIQNAMEYKNDIFAIEFYGT